MYFSYNLPAGTLSSVLKIIFLPKNLAKILFCKHFFSPLNTFIRKWKNPDPDPYHWLINSDPRCPKICGSGSLVYESTAHIYLRPPTFVLRPYGQYCGSVSGSEPFGLVESGFGTETVVEVRTDLFLLFLFCLSHVLLVNLNHGLYWQCSGAIWICFDLAPLDLDPHADPVAMILAKITTLHWACLMFQRIFVIYGPGMWIRIAVMRIRILPTFHVNANVDPAPR